MDTSDTTVHGEVHNQLLPWLLGEAGDWTRWKGRATLPSRAQVLELAMWISRPVPGHIMEFGVWKGYSTRVIRDELWRSKVWERRQRNKRIYACDSFEGLPETYEHLPQGNFATPVPRLNGVRIVKGFFDKSLTPELAEEVGRVSFAHLDADLYESTVTVLDWLTPLLGPGSLLLFDEFLGEDPAEAKAFVEWSERTGINTMLLGLFNREPSGGGGMTDRRALFQVVGDTPITKAPPLLPARLRRKLASQW
ncbi:MAG TPA: TylF/MycF/NovP-related O-methyltransferase [Actinospica sp.]|jgi:predicted O-methyltransferase YrrM|nr:TylF/MycF/NovP-related O-methyltransferase [Actinospica sp.]